MVEIRYLSANAVVIYKGHGTPAQPDPSGDIDAMTETARILKASDEKNELWIINRLDRGVAGLMIFARNKESAAILSELVRDRQITKEYFAVVEGNPGSGSMVDLLYKDARASKAYVVKTERNGVKKASLSYLTVETVTTPVGEFSLVGITLDTGRFHQIRAQFSSRRHPIVGDKKYGARSVLRGGIALMSSHLSANIKGESVDVFATPSENDYPWSLFNLSKLFGE